MRMRFTKVESVGNDYVLFDAIEEPALARADDLSHLAQVLSHRRTGVGADGLLILTSERGRLAMRVINADGSEGGVCGNGLRCAVKVALERGHVEPDDDGDVRVHVGGREVIASPTIESGAVQRVSIDMGPPGFGADDVPIDPAHAEHLGGERWRIAGHEVACASMGNPHAVVFRDDLDDPGAPRLDEIGPALERHGAFPARTNVHLATVASRDRLRVVSWERGAGATLGCGTGVCAVVALARRAGLVDGLCRVDVPGGALTCSWSGDDGAGVHLEGPARMVFVGRWGSV
ncbi:MAG: diaminopimelate epimerase [Phycisphaerales bacterium]